MHVVCRENVFWSTLEDLKKIGASSILVLPIEKMLACVKTGNKASIHTFRAAGFIQDGIADEEGCRSVRMVWRMNA